MIRRVATVVVALALLGCSCAGREASKAIEKADRAYQAEQYDQARAGYEEVLRRWPNSDAAIRAEEGLERLAKVGATPTPDSP
ncbi:MAG: hypothetical protein COW73_00540 [Nitrospirae bacterium CG18_big_fil_WC_8_21_14_2_50_70_55]|nr:hypothetical protein [Deltaproteobacteria bacterium]OIP66353.1 MAG: hypothetical protein AUK30_02625 [Nitrospirae bacterium CG2_30_70_394]PIQ07213.1 MAG: hypothetical protein COW73_00540 [Nitrospirae bacterium CG18_big_fil_WC_8_21_14_2_50_70_55]PIU78486.1 MAG: hypothetical protein COS73_07015 [Nitrospirae bacterium CG06_land_8_20_14_3_00_70_43]PIW83205.1 MAG: hypothetical protein COZ96_04600 [Nitrospirae bacterium CG_4_8_14_3_um_filter_70_85]PIX84405.1 MAG: hypothetical protein COZ33_00420 